MNDTRPHDDIYTFWGGALSLFSGKVRSYLIKKGISYREFYASHPDFKERLRPIVRLGVTPLLETPQGEVLQDSTAIIEVLEQRLASRPMWPATPVQRIVARLFDAYGTEHLMLAAMHFRWSEPYLSEQRHFLNAEFGRVAHLGTDRETRLAAGAQMISYFSGMAAKLGITPETAPAIEAEYFDLLDLLDIHFQHVPYVLGGHPSIADFGMMAPLYAHLGRDPGTGAPDGTACAERRALGRTHEPGSDRGWRIPRLSAGLPGRRRSAADARADTAPDVPRLDAGTAGQRPLLQRLGRRPPADAGRADR